MTPVVAVRDLALSYRRREVLASVSFDVEAGQCLGVLGPNGAGKTTLLRSLIGCLTPVVGEIRVDGRLPREALRHSPVAYFSGEATLPAFVRASRWGTLGTGDTVTADRRPLRALSRGTRQMIGLRTSLGRPDLAVIILDEPWEGLDADASRWLTQTLQMKRDLGAALIISSHRPDDLAGLCDAYLILLPHQPVLLQAHEISRVGPVTPALLTHVLERLRTSRVQPARILDPPA
jgi:ABC-2 type transport system ATP-binding protein